MFVSSFVCSELRREVRCGLTKPENQLDSAVTPSAAANDTYFERFHNHHFEDY